MYFIPASKSSNQLVALDTQSNKPLWRAETAGSVTSDPVITSTHVYVVTNTGSVIAYDKRTGKVTRRTPQDPRTAGQGPPPQRLLLDQKRLFVTDGWRVRLIDMPASGQPAQIAIHRGRTIAQHRYSTRSAGTRKVAARNEGPECEAHLPPPAAREAQHSDRADTRRPPDTRQAVRGSAAHPHRRAARTTQRRGARAGTLRPAAERGATGPARPRRSPHGGSLRSARDPPPGGWLPLASELSSPATSPRRSHCSGPKAIPLVPSVPCQNRRP
ncbi:PQQ-binding-like beta-propeller repeat protein [Streptomyces sp. NBC_01527]|uniref:outer membrane protein assembly factor BamB family protein n=1 Tax=Streptomyces sp. NBC_01527 TaxID=2903894 RepID=UPI00386ED2C1